MTFSSFILPNSLFPMHDGVRWSEHSAQRREIAEDKIAISVNTYYFKCVRFPFCALIHVDDIYDTLEPAEHAHAIDNLRHSHLTYTHTQISGRLCECISTRIVNIS